MNSTHRLLCFICLFILINGNPLTSDPDYQICADLTVDAAAMVDYKHPLVFKGDYFWKFDVESGLSLQFAEKISSRWPRLPTPLDAAFSVSDDKHGNSTMFIKGDKYYHYKETRHIKNGSVSEWSDFPVNLLPIDAVLTFIKRWKLTRDNEILMMKGDTYWIYTFEDSDSPTFVESDKAYINDTHSFLFLTHRKGITERTIDQVISVKAAYSDHDYVLFFGYKTYCRAMTFSTWYYCKPQNSAKFFKCPRETRPVTIPPPTTKPSATKPIIKATAVSGIETSVDNEHTTDSSMIGLTDGIRNKQTTKQIPGESKLSKDDTKKSGSSLMFIIIILIVVVLIAAVIIAVVFIVIKNKKRNTSDDKSQVKRQKSPESFDDPYDDINQPTVPRTASQESIGSMTLRSKSKTEPDEEEDENDEKGDEDFEEENEKNESEEKSDEKSNAENDEENEANSDEKSTGKENSEGKIEEKSEEKSDAKNVEQTKENPREKSKEKTDEKIEKKSEEKTDVKNIEKMKTPPKIKSESKLFKRNYDVK